MKRKWGLLFYADHRRPVPFTPARKISSNFFFSQSLLPAIFSDCQTAVTILSLNTQFSTGVGCFTGIYCAGHCLTGVCVSRSSTFQSSTFHPTALNVSSGLLEALFEHFYNVFHVIKEKNKKQKGNRMQEPGRPHEMWDHTAFM